MGLPQLKARGWQPAFLYGLIVFFLLAAMLMLDKIPFGGTKSDNIFVYLADAFLHGRLDVIGAPRLRDSNLFQGKYYPYWPPLPAFLIMVPVRVWGVYFADRWFCILMEAMTAALSWLLIDEVAKRYSYRPTIGFKILMATAFAFGTSDFYLGYVGVQWYFSQIAVALMLMISTWLLIKQHTKPLHFFLAGLFWALAILGRMHTIILAPFYLYFILANHSKTAVDNDQPGESTSVDWRLQVWQNRGLYLTRLSCLLAPVAVVVIFFGWYNWARFGSPLIALSNQQMHPRYVEEIAKYGIFNRVYFFRNVYYEVLRVPFLSSMLLGNLGLKEPGEAISWTEGYSIFFQSPMLLYAFLTLPRVRQDHFILALWSAVMLFTVTILSFVGTGWVNFGARYLFDAVPFAFLLTIIGTKGKTTPLLVLLVASACVANMIGMYLLKHFWWGTAGW